MTHAGPDLAVDVCVLGGGPAGSIAAAQLARVGLSVALVSRSTRLAAGPLGETIPPAASFILDEVAGRHFDLAGAGQLRWLGRRSSWASSEIHEHSSIFDVQGDGWRIDRTAFQGLLVSLAAENGATVLEGRVLQGRELVRDRSGWRLDLRGGVAGPHRLVAEVLVDASGRGAHAVRRIHGADHRHTIDRLVALTIEVPTESHGSMDATSVVEAVEGGYWYSVLGPGSRRVFTFFTDSDLLQSDQYRDVDHLISALGRTLHVGRLVDGLLTAESDRPRLRVHRATTSRRRSIAGDGWYVVGDAAMTFDPICSQGIYTAMRCGLEVARSVEAGTSAARSDYVALADQTWNTYMHTLIETYGAADPQRFGPDARFWQRRKPPSELGTRAIGSAR